MTAVGHLWGVTALVTAAPIGGTLSAEPGAHRPPA